MNKLVKILLCFLIINLNGCSQIKEEKIELPEPEEIITMSNMNQENDNVWVHFLDTGNSDCIIIKQNDKFAVIDGADDDDEDMIVQYLKGLGAETIDFIQLTHSDADHCGALDAIVENFTVDNVFVGNGDGKSYSYKDFITSLADNGLYPSVPLDMSKWYWDEDTYFQFFNTKDISEEPNANSIITLFVNGNDTFLFTGDAGQAEEEKYLEYFPQIDVLKVGHHGSYTSTSQKLLDKIKPSYAVILCGKDNEWEHPHNVTLNKLQGMIVHRTDLEGHIYFESNGQ